MSFLERFKHCLTDATFPQMQRRKDIQFQLVCALSDTNLIMKLLAMETQGTTAEMLAVCQTHSHSRQYVLNGSVKIVKGLVTFAKCSEQDPYITLLAYRSTQMILIHNCLLRCSVNMLYAQLFLKESSTVNGEGQKNAQPRVQFTMTIQVTTRNSHCF